jgi:protein gp37
MSTAIEWTDQTWNPVTGCTEVSEGCDHCYARTFAERWRGVPGHAYEHGFDLQLRPERLGQPLRWVKPRRVFVNSMSDLFHRQVPAAFIAQVFAVMAMTPQHTYQVLTKRPGRMRSLLAGTGFAHQVVDAGRDLAGSQQHWPAAAARLLAGPLPNVWLGVSVENQRWAGIRIPPLLATPAAVRFLSCEPLLGPVDLTRWLQHAQIPACDRCARRGPLDWHSNQLWGHCGCGCHPPRPARPDWVIVGGESGHHARPMHPHWARQLRDLCVVAGVPFFFKQWGHYRPGGDPARPAVMVNADGVVSPCTGAADQVPMVRVGKAAAGRVLDGWTWDQYPAPGSATEAAR